MRPLACPPGEDMGPVGRTWEDRLGLSGDCVQEFPQEVSFSIGGGPQLFQAA